MEDSALDFLIGAYIKVFYNDIATKVTIDVGILKNYGPNFIQLQTKDKIKWIAINKIVRIENEPN